MAQNTIPTPARIGRMTFEASYGRGSYAQTVTITVDQPLFSRIDHMDRTKGWIDAAYEASRMQTQPLDSLILITDEVLEVI